MRLPLFPKNPDRLPSMICLPVHKEQRNRDIHIDRTEHEDTSNPPLCPLSWVCSRTDKVLPRAFLHCIIWHSPESPYFLRFWEDQRKNIPLSRDREQKPIPRPSRIPLSAGKE